MAQKIDRRVLEQRIQEVEGLSSEERSALLELLHTKKYGLVWEDKSEDVEERLRKSLPVLIEDKKLALVEGGEDAPNHILIEGDNLEALTALTYTHEGKIDVIYIDPPYNTGNKDFVYNDKFVDSEDEYRHSKWLSFMDKRLRIAKRLLSDKGVIFISIDDNEQANLKLLCDEVFGESNFVANFIWKSTPGSNTGNEIKTVTESILLFAKSRNTFSANTIKIQDTNKYVLEDEYKERRGCYVLNKLDRRMTGSHYSDALNYPLEISDGALLYPGSSTSKQSHWNWRWSKQKVAWGIEHGFIVFKKNKDAWSVYFKQYQFVDNNDQIIERALPYQNLLDDDESFNSARGSSDLMNILGFKKFDYPKPMTLVKRTMEISSRKNSLVLDFFAGSGTTLHATMQLNAEDGGKRQCILVTNNENNICRDVTYERNKRVINGYTTPKGVEVEGLNGNNLRYYRTEFVDRDSSMTNKRKLMAAATELLNIKQDIYKEVHTFGSLKLRSHIARYFAERGKQMLIIYKVEAIEYLVKEIAQMPEGTDILVYVFSINNYAMDADFEDVADKVKLCALPAAIYNAYLKVLPKKKSEVAVEESEEMSNEESLLFPEEDEQ